MARVISIVFFFIFASCASTNKKEEMSMSVGMKDNLYANQSRLEGLLKTNDPVFLSLKNNSCINNWSKEVYSLKKKLEPNFKAFKIA